MGDFDNDKKTVVAKQRTLRDLVKDYNRHLEQYKACRANVKKLEAECPVGTAICWRDFVNFYSDGKDTKGGNQVTTSPSYNLIRVYGSKTYVANVVSGEKLGARGALEGG